FQKELFGLLKPALDEMKDMTSRVRQKSDLRDKIAVFEERLPVAEKALANIERLLAKSRGKAVTEALEATAEDWRQQRALIATDLQATRLQLEELVAQDVSFTEASRGYLKSFFEKRGLYLTEALLVVIGVLLLSRLSLRAMQRYLPGFRKPHRSFRIRIAELLHRLVTLFLLIVGPMVVFYLVEDWVLFSLGILLLLGVALTLRHTLPRYVKQIQLFLNIGSVREGERLSLDGLPWRVQEINFFCMLVNPDAKLTQRVPIEDLVDHKSRPASPDEPWFPCRKDDWVILGDGVRGKVIGISPELVRLVERGGAHLTYQTADFLSGSPRNLGTNFRIKETLGISYALQTDSTTRIPETLLAYIQHRVDEEGYGEQLLNLRVEFERANTSSLDIVVIADFKGELGDLYNRLRRAIQRWCVDACTEYGWDIPFPQLTVHGTLGERPETIG
ncbi:MAG: mechanosensitive ion channel family protein, partial [Chromatiaceae bacterium]|nr:mechanosensitive ion channel family protein [Chromatiaceae bacterium]